METSILKGKLSSMHVEGENVRVRFTGEGGQINDFMVKEDSPVLADLRIRKRYELVAREIPDEPKP